MNEISIDELKRIQFEILKVVHDYCVTNNLRYSLAYGTLIGAIRHKGYIPWDDDIDIMMPRQDYEVFIRSFNGFNSRFNVISTLHEPRFYAPYANVFDNRTRLVENRNHHSEIGIKIDVFPIDFVPESNSKRKLLFRLINILKRVSVSQNIIDSSARSRSSRIFARFTKAFLPWVPIPKMINLLAMRSNKNNAGSSLVNNIVWCAQEEKGCFKTVDLKDFINVEFEGGNFDALIGYHDYLYAHYGDYMSLPPKEKRIPHHDFRAYWKYNN